MDRNSSIAGPGFALACAIFASPIIVIFILVLLWTGNHFTYTLDDPYIHLTLARNIWAGHYGINANEPSAPSSSVIWPLLLAPFSAFSGLFEFAPLIINGLCAVLSGLTLLAIFSGIERKRAIVTSLVAMLALNIYGLVFTGMEHSLQVLLVLVVVYGLIHEDLLATRKKLRMLFYASLVFLPLIRYEGLAISLPVLICRMNRGDKRIAAISIMAILASLLIFSLFLKSLGLGLLPSSVLAKSSHTGLNATLYNIKSNIRQYGWLLGADFVLCCWVWKENKSLALVLAGAAMLHFCFGKYGWYGRYEVYFVAFVMLIGFNKLIGVAPRLWIAVFALPSAFPTLASATLSTPLAASNIYNEQGQMVKIAQMLDDKVAVNDLGLISFRSDHYVLDLWGLGSLDALRNRVGSNAGADWISNLMSSKGVSYAFVYDQWFPQRPSNWNKVAELRLLQRTISPASDVISFYATSSAKAEKLRAVLERFKLDNVSTNFSVEIIR